MYANKQTNRKKYMVSKYILVSVSTIVVIVIVIFFLFFGLEVWIKFVVIGWFVTVVVIVITRQVGRVGLLTSSSFLSGTAGARTGGWTRCCTRCFTMQSPLPVLFSISLKFPLQPPHGLYLLLFFPCLLLFFRSCLLNGHLSGRMLPFHVLVESLVGHEQLPT